MECTYNETTKKFKLIYFDALKAYKGSKYPYGRKQKAWNGKKAPTKKERDLIIQELLAEGAALEEFSKVEVEKLKNEFVVIDANNEVKKEEETNGFINAVRYIMAIKPQDLTTKGKVSSRHTSFLTTFTEFLKKNYPLTPLHELKKPHFVEYFNSISKYSTDVQTHHYFYLLKIWKNIVNEFEESPIKYVNILDKYGKSEFVAEKLPFEKMPFTVEELKRIFWECLIMEESTTREQLFFVLYFLFITGWRVGDILNLTWEQVNFGNRTIRVMHSKTKDKTGHETIIFITPLMKEILERQQASGKKHPYNSKYVFNIRKQCREYKDMGNWGNEILKFIHEAMSKMDNKRSIITPMGQEMKTYTTHCIRKSVTTELNLSPNFTSERIKYLLGHSDNSTEAKHYLKFKLYPERSTRDMLEYMEELTGARDSFNILSLGWGNAYSKLNEITDLSDTEIEQLKFNFWTTEAIQCLSLLLKRGFEMARLQHFIRKMQELRIDTGEKEITAKLVTEQIKNYFDRVRNEATEDEKLLNLIKNSVKNSKKSS